LLNKQEAYPGLSAKFAEEQRKIDRERFKLIGRIEEFDANFLG